MGSPCSSAENTTSHWGDGPWPNGSANYNTVLSWINAGRSARNSTMPPFLRSHTPEIVIARNGTRLRGVSANPYALLTPPSR
jgi:hypothetical protein